MSLSLRATMLSAAALWTLAATLLGGTVARDLMRLETSIAEVRGEVMTGVHVEDARWRLVSLIEASRGVARGLEGAAERAAVQQRGLSEALARVDRAAPVDSDARAKIVEARTLSLPDLARYVERAGRLAEAGRHEEALSLVDSDLDALAGARFRTPLASLAPETDDARIRKLDRKLAGIASHWGVGEELARSVRSGLLLEVVEARLLLEAGHVLETAAHHPERRRDRSALLERLAALGKARASVELAADTRTWYERYAAPDATVEPLLAGNAFDMKLAGKLRDRADANQRFVASRLEASATRVSRLRAAVLSLTALCFLSGLAAPRWVRKRFSAPIGAITEWVEDRNSGDRDADLPVAGRDEIGRLTDAMRDMEADLDEFSRKTENLAFYDNVTGLPNRQLFQEKLQGAILWAKLHRRSVAVLSLHVGSFKELNNARGHDVGDELLRQIASRVAHHVRLGDLVARPDESEPVAHVSRLGGSDFTLLLTNIERPEDAGRVASRLLAEAARPFTLDTEEFIPSTSIGIAVYPLDGSDASALIANAHVASRHARNHSVSHFQFYSEAMNATVSRKLDVAKRLHGALEAGTFTLNFQPILDARSHEISSAEVLLRWTDPELGPVPPSEFIPVAEETGLIGQIGDWVIQAACEQARQWREEGYQPIRLAVNVSPLQIRDPKWSAHVARVLEETEMVPGGLELEITESAIMRDDAATVSTLTGFKEMGVGLALDDFGTGYSSLSYLHRYPIDRVKIDRSFVAEIALEDAGTELTAAILAMARSLRLKVVAEGIETEEQANFLAERGCDEVQGFLYAKPMPAHDFEKLMKREKDETLEA